MFRRVVFLNLGGLWEKSRRVSRKMVMMVLRVLRGKAKEKPFLLKMNCSTLSPCTGVFFW